LAARQHDRPGQSARWPASALSGGVCLADTVRGLWGGGDGEGRKQGDRQAGGDEVLDEVVVGGVPDIGLEAGGAG
jgi:hypothetical protein